MDDSQAFALTDDEAAALALAADGAWRTPLPTVDASDGASLAAAVRRGRRSLLVRDLAEANGTLTGAAASVLAGLGSGPCAAFLLVDGEGDWVSSGPTVYLYGQAPESAGMSHVVAASGVHYFRLVPQPGQWRALTDLAEAVFVGGFTAVPDGVRQPAAAVLSMMSPAGFRSVRVSQGEVAVFTAEDPIPFASVTEAIAWMSAAGSESAGSGAGGQGL